MTQRSSSERFRPTSLALPVVAWFGLLAGCAEGGSEERTTSEIKVSANHYLYGFGGDQGFTEFPVPTEKIGTDRGTLALTDASEYTITRGSQTSQATEYGLANDGELILVVPIASFAPTRYIGAYHQSDSGFKTQTYFFTDRYAPDSAPIVGFFWGTRTVDPTDYAVSDLRGDWFLFSQHVIFTTNPTFNPHNVGRSFGGSVVIKQVTDVESVTGSGTDSSGATVGITGNIPFNDSGNMTLSLSYAGDERVFKASHAKEVILGVDEDETTGESGLVALIKQGELDSLGEGRTGLAGEWHVGLHTIFVAPKNSGIDAANGTLTFDSTGGWQLEGVGSKGPVDGKFTYTGTYEFRKISSSPDVYDNWLTLKVSGAQAVANYMQDAGFDVARLVVTGYGPDQPESDNGTPEGRAANRRIEFSVQERSE